MTAKIESVTEAHKELFHYTTGVGLEGILTSRQLRATHAAFLNDAEEQVGFLKYRLPGLIRESAKSALEEICTDQTHRTRIDGEGGIEVATDRIVRDLSRAVEETVIGHDVPFVTCFCSHKRDEDEVSSNGLLSQWRGYGVDGGYAIVFETSGIHALLKLEEDKFLTQGFMGDVDYYKGDNLPETIEDETAIKVACRKFLLTGDHKHLKDLPFPMSRRTMFRKHHGFAEEQEVRIVTLIQSERVLEGLRKAGHDKPSKDIQFAARQGVLVPFVSLFGPSVGNPPLPVKRIIIGPHPDQKRRRKGLELLLRQLKLQADLVESNIPYLGR